MINWWCGDLNLAENTVPKYFMIDDNEMFQNFRDNIGKHKNIVENPQYKGDAFFQIDNENNVKDIKLLTDRIIIDIDQNTPDKLIINQNYNSNWKSDKGEVYNATGFLGVDLPEFEDGEVNLYYHQNTCLHQIHLSKQLHIAQGYIGR